jgi:hypothetical protein
MFYKPINFVTEINGPLGISMLHLILKCIINIFICYILYITYCLLVKVTDHSYDADLCGYIRRIENKICTSVIIVAEIIRKIRMIIRVVGLKGDKSMQ